MSMDSKRELFFLELNEVLIFIYKKKLNATEAWNPNAKKKIVWKTDSYKNMRKRTFNTQDRIILSNYSTK